MNKAELFRNAVFQPDNVSQQLRIRYGAFVHSELVRIAGVSKPETVDAVLENVHSRLCDINMDSDVSCLVFDCIRKETIRMCRQNSLSSCANHTGLLSRAKFDVATNPKDDLRLDLALLFLTSGQRSYFLRRYYYLRDDIRSNFMTEYAVKTLINGKGVASFRFRALGIPRKKVTADYYVDYFDRIDKYYISNMSKKNVLWESPRISDIPPVYRVMERHHRIAQYSIPLSVLAVLIFILILVAQQLF